MEYFKVLTDLTARVPDWCIFLPPCIFIALFVPLVLKRCRRIYTGAALLLGGAGCLLLSGDAAAMLAYGVCFAILWGALFPFFFLPKREKKSREERIYETFKPEIEPRPRREKELPKVCCFDEPTADPSLEDGICLDHVRKLLDRLRREKLSAADRLEVDTLAGRLTGEAHTAAEAEARNDALASVLRLTAKYKL